MALAEVDDLADIFFGSALSQRKREDHPCDNCDNCDKQATARIGKPVQGLRHIATACDTGLSSTPVVASVAACRKGQNSPDSEQWRGLSQKSQMSQVAESQGSEAAKPSSACDFMALVAWTDADIERFLDRRARLMRWGWTEPEAEKLAERLVRRDREHDERVSCADCGHYRPGRCDNHRNAGLSGPDVGRNLAETLQRCPGFDRRGTQ